MRRASPPAPTPALLFTVPVWRLGELFHMTTAISLCSDNFIINSGWDEQNLLRWPLVSAALTSIYDFVFTCCGSHRLYPRAGVVRDLCVLKNFLWRLMYLGDGEEYVDLMWVWGKLAGRRYELLKMWGWLLFVPQTKWQSEVKKQKHHSSTVFGLVSSELWTSFGALMMKGSFCLDLFLLSLLYCALYLPVLWQL